MPKVFVSYAREDVRWVKEGETEQQRSRELIPRFRSWLRSEGVEIWADPELCKRPSDEYLPIIRREIDTADLAILLISESFVASEFILTEELPRIRARVEKGEMAIVSILVGHLSARGKERIAWIFARQVLPGDPTPLIRYAREDDEWDRVCVQLTDAIGNTLRVRRSPAPAAAKSETPASVQPLPQPEKPTRAPTSDQTTACPMRPEQIHPTKETPPVDSQLESLRERNRKIWKHKYLMLAGIVAVFFFTFAGIYGHWRGSTPEGNAATLSITAPATPLPSAQAGQGGVAPMSNMPPVADTPPQGATAEGGAGQVEAMDLGGGVTLELVWIPPGTFMMGSPKNEERRGLDEVQHQVTLTSGFWMGKYEVTQGQWQAVMGSNPSRFNDDVRLPVMDVSWDDCQEFFKKLNTQVEGGRLCLPTEAQWEYACRAGTTTPFCFGETISPEQVNYDGHYRYAKGSEGESRQKATVVGGFPANAWGLHDMHGNVWEWCQDWYERYPPNAVTDPTGAHASAFRVLRGGSWRSRPEACRSADRVNYTPAGRGDVDGGFRVVRTP